MDCARHPSASSLETTSAFRGTLSGFDSATAKRL